MNDQNLYSATTPDSQQRIKSDEEILIDRIMACFAKRGEVKERSIYFNWSADELQTYLDGLEQDTATRPMPDEEEPTPPPLPNGHDKAKSRDKNSVKGPAIKVGAGFWQKTLHDLFMDARMSSTEKVMVNVLSALSGQKGYCWHSEESIGKLMVSKAKPTGLCIRHVRRSLHTIRDCGYIRILTPDQSKAAGFDTKEATTNTIVMNMNFKS